MDAEKKVSDKQEEIEKKTEECIDTEKNTKTEVSTKEFISFAKKEEVLYRLTLRRGYDDYYSAEVNAVIDYILGKKDRLNEKFIDELSEKCSIEGCITEEDRKKEGDAIVKAAKKWFEESNQTEVGTEKFTTLAKKEKILLYLEGHKNGNSYSQGSSYSQKVREKITFILKNKNLLDEKLIDELYDACLIKACFNEEDRKRKGEAIVCAADRICEKSKGIKEKTDESEENTKNTQTVVAKTEKKTEVAKKVPSKQKEIVGKIENNI